MTKQLAGLVSACLRRQKESIGSSMSQGVFCVKEEPAERVHGAWDTRAEATAVNSLHIVHETQQELVIGPEAQQAAPAVFPDHEIVKMEAVIVKEEPKPKDEFEGGDECSAVLCTNPAVKHELVRGPGHPQPGDATLALQDVSEQALVVSCREPEPAPERGRGGEQPAPRDCSMRLERCAGLEAEDGRHMQIDTAPRPRKRAPKTLPPRECRICHKQFNYTSHLKNHILTHTQEKPYNCGICNKNFSLLWNLKAHERIHKGEKMYSCDICKKAFTHLANLNKHRFIHTGEKPFSCKICKKQFSQSSNLKKHEVNIHMKKKPPSAFAEKSILIL